MSRRYGAAPPSPVFSMRPRRCPVLRVTWGSPAILHDGLGPEAKLEDSRSVAATWGGLNMATALINDSDIWRLQSFSQPAALSAGTHAAKVKHPVSRICFQHQREVVIFFVLCSACPPPPAHSAAGDSDAMSGFENKPKQV